MEKVPKMISTKDLAYISDMFNWNITTFNKINLYLENVEDKALVKLLENLSDLHYNNCEELIKILEGSGK